MLVLRKETMRIRTLESEIKSVNKLREQQSEQFRLQIESSKSKFEKEHASVISLTESLRAAEGKVKEYQTGASRATELEHEKHVLEKQIRTFKVQIDEYTSYKLSVSVKLAAYDQIDEDLIRLRAEN